MKQARFIYGKHSYDYFLVHQDRKTVALTVHPNLNIVLKCPLKYDYQKIEKFLKRKWHWMEQQHRYFRKFKSKSDKKDYVSGESFLYLGRQYKLEVKKGKDPQVGLTKGRIIMHTNKSLRDSTTNKIILNKWYTIKTQSLFDERLTEVLKKFNYNFTPDLVIRKMSKRWGSFLSSKKIILNPLLIKASKECIDYVIAHELCHMTHKNHTKQFYRLLESVVPKWEQIKEKLELRFL